jgi:hypothetical protein
MICFLFSLRSASKHSFSFSLFFLLLVVVVMVVVVVRGGGCCFYKVPSWTGQFL